MAKIILKPDFIHITLHQKNLTYGLMCVILRAMKAKDRLKYKGIPINLIRTRSKNYEVSVEGNVVCYDRNKAKAIKIARRHIEKNIAI